MISANPCGDDFSLDSIVLEHGSHGEQFQGHACMVEWANQATVCCSTLAEKFGKAAQFEDDHPSISPVVRSYAIGLNDAWTAPSWMAKHPEDWKRLRPYVTKILGTKTTPEEEETRAWLATDWLVRVHTPAFLRLAGLTEHAQALEGLARIVDAITCGAAQPTLDAARSGAAAARAAAGDAAWAAAWDAAGDAAWDAAGDAARAAAWDAAGDAAWDAAWDAARAAAWAAAGAAAWDAAGDAAWDAAGDAAWDAAWDAARAAAWAAAGAAARAAAGDAAWAAAGDAARAAAGDAARAAAWAAAGERLYPTVKTLQDSALELFDALIAVGRS